VELGQSVARGQVLARGGGLWGLLQGRCRSPVDGVLREVSRHTGVVLVEVTAPPVTVRALIAGTVVAVAPRRGVTIEGVATVVQGVFGVGADTVGRLVAAVRRPEGVLTAEIIGPELAGCVVLGGALVTGAALRRAGTVGVGALVTGGIEDADLTALLGSEVSVAVTGGEDVRPAVVVTGGFGRVAPDPVAYGLLLEREGSLTAVSPFTRVRAGAVRPEILVTEAAGAGVAAVHGDGGRDDPDGTLAPGRRVRLLGAMHLGRTGVVRALLPDPRTFPSEARLPAVQVELPGDRRIVVPRANVELLDTPAPPARPHGAGEGAGREV
jgi:hypothetical protein